MTRAQTVMDLLGSLHTLQLDYAWMMRLPVARKHLSGYCFLCNLLIRLKPGWLGSAGGEFRDEAWGDRGTISFFEILDNLDYAV